MNDFIQSPSVISSGEHVRMYFCSRNKPDEQGRYCSYIGYADLDPNDLTKVLSVSEQPQVALGETGTFDEFGTYPVSAVRHEDEIRLYYGGITRCATVPFNAAIGCAISSDGGYTFVKPGPGPIISYSPDEPFVVGSTISGLSGMPQGGPGAKERTAYNRCTRYAALFLMMGSTGPNSVAICWLTHWKKMNARRAVM
jgi:hypothetical protein